LNGKLDKFGAPYGIYCLLSGMMKYFQRVEKLRNPEAVPDNPYEAKLEELLEKGVREALEAAEREQKEYEAKKSRKGKKPSTAGSRQPIAIENKTEAAGKSTSAESPTCPSEPEGRSGMEQPTEKELGALDNMLGEMLGKDPKEGLKKLFGDLFKQQ
jgi:hypothetical protein